MDLRPRRRPDTRRRRASALRLRRPASSAASSPDSSGRRPRRRCRPRIQVRRRCRPACNLPGCSLRARAPVHLPRRLLQGDRRSVRAFRRRLPPVVERRRRARGCPRRPCRPRRLRPDPWARRLRWRVRAWAQGHVLPPCRRLRLLRGVGSARPRRSSRATTRVRTGREGSPISHPSSRTGSSNSRLRPPRRATMARPLRRQDRRPARPQGNCLASTTDSVFR